MKQASARSRAAGRERAEAGALLLDHGLEMDPRVGLKPAFLIASSA